MTGSGMATLHRTPAALEPDTSGVVEWAVSQDFIDYEAAVAAMEARVADIAAGRRPELVWLLEHPPLYTAGTSARAEDLLAADRFPVHKTGRGGHYTYHGPGQRVIYVMLDIKRRTGDVRAYVGLLERWIITALAELGVRGETRSDRVGVWVPRPELGPGREDKIAALGIRVRKWISFHGISINVAPDLDHFSGINPCGVTDQGVTSLADLGHATTMAAVDQVLAQTFTDLIATIRPATVSTSGAG